MTSSTTPIGGRMCGHWPDLAVNTSTTRTTGPNYASRTRQEGGPHKLFLTKADDVVKRDRQTRSSIETELAGLRRRMA